MRKCEIEEILNSPADTYQSEHEDKIKITGSKVHDVGDRYFLMSMAMSNRIWMFEAHNIEGSGDEVVQVFADGDEEAVKAFLTLVETKRPASSEV